jgi:hypothetical protein
MPLHREERTIPRLAQFLCCALTANLAVAQSAGDDADVLEPITVLGQRIANVQPASSYAALVTGLRYDRQIDVQARGLPEGQADITVACSKTPGSGSAP